MEEILGLLIWGFLVGGYGTLVGIGGGPLLVPVIAIVYHYPTPNVIAISLFVIFFNTLSGSLAYLRDKRVDIVSGTKFGLATIPGSLISTFAVYYVHLNIFTFLFGSFLLALAFYIYLKPITSEAVLQQRIWAGNGVSAPSVYQQRVRGSRYHLVLNSGRPNLRPRNLSPEPGYVKRIITDELGNTYRYQFNEGLGIAITILISIFSTFLGIGGGLILVPVLVYLLAFPVHIASATSHYVTAINTCFTLIPFMVNGDILYRPAITLSIGAIIGAQVGAKLSNDIPGNILLKLLIPVFMFMGVRLLFF
ncbi:MAG: sulfite exporter TauE/SafE family protein [Deltaproteobacteria bacterium]|nr:sulfite exporter TauE/SafE family protein [Deltaproteobacteria bacterium]